MRIWQVLLAVYVMSGLLAAVGGLLFSGTTGSVGPDQTNSYLLPSVAATVIGGTSILGGVGGYTGTILGAIVLTLLNRLLLRLDTSEAFKQMLYGAIVLALAWLYVRLSGRNERAADPRGNCRDRMDGGRAHRGAAAHRCRRRRDGRLVTGAHAQQGQSAAARAVRLAR